MGRMMDARLFTPLPAEQRRRIADDYVAFALRRDGEPDVVKRTLSRREEFFREFDARPKPVWTGEPIAQHDFSALHRGVKPLAGVSPLVWWLVQVSRANEGEAWGVDYLLDRGGFDGLGKGGRLKPRDFADLEETYHTRIMHTVVRLFGIDYSLREPPRVIQQSVKLMSRLPHRGSYVLLLAGELMGTVAFLRMAQHGDKLLEPWPEFRTLVRELLDEILIDEIGHVTFLLGSMNAVELAAIRHLAKLYMRVSRLSYSERNPDTEIILRGISNYSLALFPERVLRRAFVPAQYWPDAYGPQPGLAA
jgi:hypothetical protein